MNKLIPMNISGIRDLMEQEKDGERVPFSICYACQNGGVVDIKEKCIVCIGVDTHRHTHTIKSINSSEIRKVRDCLILRINNSKIVMS